MNDTNSIQLVHDAFHKNVSLSSSEVSAIIGDSLSLVTVKRQLSKLAGEGFLIQTGAGRSVKYMLSKKGILLKDIDVQNYLSIEADQRLERSHFQQDIFEAPFVTLFDESELEALDRATQQFQSRAKNNDHDTRSKELMRFIVEFSWKSSQIEGNTYDLLSTERLLLYGEKSPTNTEFEAQMILNQKKALEFILEDVRAWQKPTIAHIEKLHDFVADKLGITKSVRKSLIGITGTNYKPLENEFQIKEAMQQLIDYLKLAGNSYEKSILGILGLSYIQPFVDGNKRTSRLFGNAILISNDMPPLSYRSVDDRVYKEATLMFYEQNSIVAFKKLFLEQYVFSAENYNFANNSKI